VPSSLNSAGIGDAGKKVGERFHLLCTDHHFLASCTIIMFENRLGQQCLRVGNQRLDKNHLGGVCYSTVTFLDATKTLGVACIDPVICLVDGSQVPLWIYKGFQKNKRMTKSSLPIPRQSLAG